MASSSRQFATTIILKKTKFNHGPSNLVYFSLLSEAPCTSYYDDPSVHWCCVAASARCREFDIHKGEIPHHKIERPGCTCIPKLSIQQHYYRIKRLAATRNASCWDTAAAVRTRDIRMSSRPRAEYVNRVGYANYTLKHRYILYLVRLREQRNILLIV